MKFWDLYDKAVAEVDADRTARINEAYIAKLEQRVQDMESGLVTDKQIETFMTALNNSPEFDTRTILKIKLVRAAFNLGLKEAKEIVEKYTPLPF